MSIYHLAADRLIASPSRCTVEKMLIENEHIIETIGLYQGKGRAAEAAKYQALLHRNLVTLARLADAFRARQPPVQPTEQPATDDKLADLPAEVSAETNPDGEKES